MFKFDITVDDSFCRLNERMMVQVIVFRSAVLPKPRAQTEMADDKVTKNGRQNFAECLAGSFSSSSGRLQYLQIATS